MREIRQSGSEGGEAELNRPSLPLSTPARLLPELRPNQVENFALVEIQET